MRARGRSEHVSHNIRIRLRLLRRASLRRHGQGRAATAKGQLETSLRIS